MIRLRLSHAVLALLLGTALPAAAFEYAGAGSCEECHAEAVAAWKLSPHANAERSLGTKAKEPACLTCHAPQKKKGLDGVSCEACHGPGKAYKADFVMRDPELARAVGLVEPAEKQCLVCHDASSPSLEPFVWAHKRAALDHWSAEWKRRGKAPKSDATEKRAEVDPSAVEPACPAAGKPSAG